MRLSIRHQVIVMDNNIEPTIKISGSAFQDHSINNRRPKSALSDRDNTKVVPLSEWCRQNFISVDIGYTLIKLKLLIGFRRHHVWWVCANPACIEQLLDYLGLEQLYFDADNQE